jgi:DNA-binding HxlR family transcriptional regulator
MATTATLATQQGIAYVIAAHGVLQRQSVRSKCPVALLHTLLALESMNTSQDYLPARTSELQRVMQISLPLLRGYVRELAARKYVERVSFFRRGPRLLRLTKEGKSLVGACQRAMRDSAARVLEWQMVD